MSKRTRGLWRKSSSSSFGSSETIKITFEDTTDVFDLLDRSEQQLLVAEGNIRQGYQEMGAVIRQVIEGIDQARLNEEGVSGVPPALRTSTSSPGVAAVRHGGPRGPPRYGQDGLRFSMAGTWRSTTMCRWPFSLEIAHNNWCGASWRPVRWAEVPEGRPRGLRVPAAPNPHQQARQGEALHRRHPGPECV